MRLQVLWYLLGMESAVGILVQESHILAVGDFTCCNSESCNGH